MTAIAPAPAAPTVFAFTLRGARACPKNLSLPNGRRLPSPHRKYCDIFRVTLLKSCRSWSAHARLAAAILALPLLGIATSLRADEPVAVAAAAAESAPQLVTIDDPTAVYTKAFWRRPGQEDSILHAERREWRDAAGAVVSWQWFLVVEPSQQTRDWLATNPFLLQPAPVSKISLGPAGPPDWFPVDKLTPTPLQDPTGHHILALSPDGKRLYATDSGSGFAPKATTASTSPKK